MPGSNSRPNVSEGYEVPTELPGSTGFRMQDCIEICPPMEIKAAGHNTLIGTAQGTLLVVVCDTQDICRDVKLPIVLVPSLGRNLFFTAMAAQKGVKTTITKAGSIVDLGLFSIELAGSDDLHHLDLAFLKESKRTESACCAISGKSFSKEIILTASVPQKPVALPAESINLWHRKLGHPNETVLRKVRDLGPF